MGPSDPLARAASRGRRACASWDAVPAPPGSLPATPEAASGGPVRGWVGASAPSGFSAVGVCFLSFTRILFSPPFASLAVGFLGPEFPDEPFLFLFLVPWCLGGDLYSCELKYVLEAVPVCVKGRDRLPRLHFGGLRLLQILHIRGLPPGESAQDRLTAGAGSLVSEGQA
jgi:hypothetical protein